MAGAPRLLCAALLLCCLAHAACALDLGSIFGRGEDEEQAVDQSQSPMVVKSSVALNAAADDGARAALQLPLGGATNV